MRVIFCSQVHQLLFQLSFVLEVLADMEKVNAVGRLEHFQTMKLLSELTSGAHYDVTKMSILTTRYGPRIIVELNGDFKTFLPSRFVKLFQDDPEYFEKMQEFVKSNKVEIIYIGGKYNALEFQLK